MTTNLMQHYLEKSARGYCELKERVLKEVIPVEFHDPAKFEKFATLHKLECLVAHEKPDEEQLWLDGKYLGTFVKNIVTYNSNGFRVTHKFVPANV